MKQEPTHPGQAPQPDAAAPSAPVPVERRFLGGVSADGVTKRGTIGVRLFASASAFMVLVLLLLMFVLSLRDQFGERLLVTAAVATYTAPEFPPLEFVQQDLDRLRNAAGPALRLTPEAAELPNFSTSADLTRLIEEVLPTARQNSLIVFVRMHAVSTPAGLFLAPADGDPDRPQDGIALARLLQAAAKSPCRNKFILLDIVQNDQRPSIGWPGTDARRHVELAFEAVQAEIASDAGLYLVCATGEGQISRSSAAVQHSLFGGLAGYCLHGGFTADGAGPTGRRDSRLTAGEIGAFLQQHVADWSLDRWGVLQEPVVLQSGRDFPLVSVNEFLPIEVYFADRESLPHAGQAENQRRKQEFADRAVAAAPPPAGSPPAGPELVPTPDLLAPRLLQSWQHKQTLASTNAPLRRPRHWALYHQEQRRAEMLLLAGRVTDAITVLDTSLAPLERDLDVPAGELLRQGWSSAYADLPAEANSRWATLLQDAITAPTGANLDRLRGAPFVELELARRAAERLSAGDAAMPAWSDPKLLQQVLTVRSLAERAGRLSGHLPAATTTPAETAPAVLPSMPALLPVMRARLEAADRLRLAAEHELLVGRLDAARGGLTVAQQEYEATLDAGRGVEQQLNLVHATLIDAASLGDWLAQSRRPATWRQQAWKKLDALLAGAAEFRRAPTPELLAPLAGLCRDLRQAGTAAAREAVAERNPVELRAALELPFLDPVLRGEVLWTAVNLADGPRPVSGRRRFAGDSTADNASAFPLASLRRAAAAEGEVPQAALTGNPGGHTAPAQFDAGAPVGELPAGERFRQALAEWHADPLALPPGATGYEQFVAYLARAPFQSQLLRLTSFRPVAAEELFARMTSDQLTWQLARLAACETATGIDVSGPRAVVLQNLREIDPSYQESQGRPVAAFDVSSGQTTSDSARSRVSVTLTLRSALKLADADKPQFVVDWFTQRQLWRVVSLHHAAGGDVVQPDAARDLDAATAVTEWRTRVSVGELARQAAAEVTIELQRDPTTAPLASDDIVPLATWIELADGSRYRVPVELNLRGHAPPAFEVAITSPSGTPFSGRVRLFPNQRVPISIGVLSHEAEPTPIMIDVSSGASTVDVPHTAAPGAKPSPVAASGPTGLTVSGARLKVESLLGRQAIDSEEVSIEVLNPRTTFACKAQYQAASRTLTIVVRRLAESDAAAAVPVEFNLAGARVEEGSLVGEIPADAAETTLEAKLLRDDPNAPCVVSVGICGVPDTFVFQVDDATGVVARTYASRCDIVHPAEGTTFLRTGDATVSLPIEIAADAAGECLISVGIDRNNDGYLQVSERIRGQTTWSGKSVEARLVAAGEPPEWAIESRVARVLLPLPVAGLVGPQRLLAQLIAGDRTLTASRMVYFVEGPPTVEVAAPQQNEPIALGDPLPIALRCRHAAARAVTQVQVGVDRNNNGAWDDDETFAPAVPAESGADPFELAELWRGQFDTRHLLEPAGAKSEPPMDATPADTENVELPRRLVLMARTSSILTDLAHPEQPPQAAWGPPVRRIIELISMSEKPIPTGSVAGRVTTVDGVPQRDVVITLGERQTRTNDDGRFLLRNVPIGQHVVSGFRGLRSGQVEVVVTAGATSEVPLTIAR